MENLIAMVREEWPTILEYVFMFLVYFVVYFYRKKFKDSELSITTLFKEKVSEFSNSELAYKEQVSIELTESMAKLQAMQTAYDKAIKKVQKLEKKLDRLESAIVEVVEDLEVLDHGEMDTEASE